MTSEQDEFLKQRGIIMANFPVQNNGIQHWKKIEIAQKIHLKQLYVERFDLSVATNMHCFYHVATGAFYYPVGFRQSEYFYLDQGVKREEIFVTSKLWNNKHAPKDVRPALMKTLKDLQLDYLDLYLIHSPLAYKAGDDIFPVDELGNVILTDAHYTETWKEMEKLVKEGLVKSIGMQRKSHYVVRHNFCKSQDIDFLSFQGSFIKVVKGFLQIPEASCTGNFG